MLRPPRPEIVPTFSLNSIVGSSLYKDNVDKCIAAYDEMIESGIAPEQARFILPQGVYTEWWWTGSLSAYARVYNQRIEPHAQWEVREYAKAIGKIIEDLFPEAWTCLTERTKY